MIYIPSYGSYVLGLWWMCRGAGRESSTFLRVTWNKCSKLFHFIVLFLFSSFCFQCFRKMIKVCFCCCCCCCACFQTLIAFVGFCSWKHQQIRSWISKSLCSIFLLRSFVVLLTFDYWYSISDLGFYICLSYFVRLIVKSLFRCLGICKKLFSFLIFAINIISLQILLSSFIHFPSNWLMARLLPSNQSNFDMWHSNVTLALLWKYDNLKNLKIKKNILKVKILF